MVYDEKMDEKREHPRTEIDEPAYISVGDRVQAVEY